MRHDEKLDDDTRLRTEDLVAAGETRPADANELPPPRTADDNAEYSRPDSDERTDDETFARDTDTGEFDRDRFDTDRTHAEHLDTDRTDTGYEADRTDADAGMTDTDQSDMDRTDADRTDMDPTHMDRADLDGTGTDRTDTDGTEVAPVEASDRPTPMADDSGDEMRQLFRPEDVDRFRTEWQQVQIMFVDDPQEAVRGADHLVAEVMQALATMFNEHKQELEGHWREGSDLQTEDLRIALRHYRSFFNQLLDA